ncbi:3-dehydroquinate dehydratase (3-dehydroquinase) [Coemansia sp. 'formosensis']|nr:3-dehydroquinate dehydratase (3-dehydroquinase) [Coemansia sp. 'formosensis']
MTRALKLAEVERIPILGTESIVCGFHLVDYIWTDIFSNLPAASTYVLITDTNLAKLYLSKYEESFQVAWAHHSQASAATAPRLLTHVLPPGELSKSRATKSAIEDWMFSEKCTRDTMVLALGGGVIGDLVGYVAATFMRGVGFIQIPTSLLAMVDSSIGGKTAVDTPAGKNLVGSFWQPKRIYMDMAVLSTLPPREFSNGMAEVVKTAAIWDAAEFDVLEASSVEVRRAVLSGTQDADAGLTLATRSEEQKLLQRVIAASARVKAYVVTHDERESGMRGLLNFGHTIGHAIEAILSPQVLHGECVAVGCVLEAEVARRMGHLSEVGVARLVRCLRAYGLPTTMDDPLLRGLASSEQLAEVRPQRLMDIMGVDKKTVGTQKRLVVLKQLGATLELKPTNVSDALILEVLSAGVLVKPVGDDSAAAETVVVPPGSKSISNRALQLAALGKGVCRLRNLLHSDDTQVMMAALQAMGGCEFAWEDGGDTLVVMGGGGALHAPTAEVYLGNAGTAARFLTTTVNLISSGGDSTVLTGNARMKLRPCGPLVDALRANGCAIDYCEKEGSLPLRVSHSGGRGFPGGRIQLAASVSSQYVSSILLCAPYAQEPVRLELVGGKVISQPYIDMTLAMMAQFGCQVQRISETEYLIPLGAYTNPAEYVVESDASSATYPLAFAAITGRQCTVPNIGSASLQGDARFAVDVLRPMGCTVEQTATSTTVRGPPRGQLLALGDIDMEPMTDAFLTASVLAAVAPGNGGVTRIRGIANQHVKECDRIQAMCTELARFGVTATNHADGIDVHARPFNELASATPSVHCYDDHRVAMSFSVLACLAPGGAELRERRCVGKTWPQWWDVLARDLGAPIAGAEPQEEEHVEAEAASVASPSVVVVGMRGAGKSTLSKAAASALGLAFVDMDEYLEQQVGQTIPAIIASEGGWAAFRAHESRLLAQALTADFATGAIIACGGGVVEAPENRALLQRHMCGGGAVICLTPNMDQVADFLSQDKTRPAYAAGDARDVYERRKPLYSAASNYEILVDKNLPGAWPRIEREFVRLVAFASGRDCNRVDLAHPSYFVSLTAGDVGEYLANDRLAAVTAGAHAVELRADLLAAIDADDWLAKVHWQFALLRHATPLPVVFTVRTVAQGGAFRGTDAQRLALLHAALRWGAEYVDVEVDAHAAALYAARRNTLVIASHHDPTGRQLRWAQCEFATEILHRARACGDIVKLISFANQWSDNIDCLEFVKRHHSPATPLIALNMGYAGQMSRVLCPVLTPATHPLLAAKAAPGQISVQQINVARATAGLLPARKMALCGTPVQQSPGPAMHNAAFSALGLPHVYGLCETAEASGLAELFADPEFGGASITIPLKQAVIPLLAHLTPAARRIGAVNTVIPTTQGGKSVLVGDNTDYLGIVGCLRRAQVAAFPKASALVVGAGGTSRAALYALYTLGVGSVMIYNRTAQRAEELVAEFSELFASLVSVSDLAAVGSPDYVVGTIPACELVYPDSLFAKGGVALDMAYKPRWTPLLEAAKRHGWSVVSGIDVLIEQGIHQMEKWTHLTAPTKIMAEAAYAKYNANS